MPSIIPNFIINIKLETTTFIWIAWAARIRWINWLIIETSAFNFYTCCSKRGTFICKPSCTKQPIPFKIQNSWVRCPIHSRKPTKFCPYWLIIKLHARRLIFEYCIVWFIPTVIVKRTLIIFSTTLTSLFKFCANSLKWKIVKLFTVKWYITISMRMTTNILL